MGALLPSLGTGASKLAKGGLFALASTRTALKGGGRPRARGHNVFVTSSALLTRGINFQGQIYRGIRKQVQFCESVEESLVQGAGDAVEFRPDVHQLLVGDGGFLKLVEAQEGYLEVPNGFLQ